jgi:hypothetical protein
MECCVYARALLGRAMPCDFIWTVIKFPPHFREFWSFFNKSQEHCRIIYRKILPTTGSCNSRYPLPFIALQHSCKSCLSRICWPASQRAVLSPSARRQPRLEAASPPQLHGIRFLLLETLAYLSPPQLAPLRRLLRRSVGPRSSAEPLIFLWRTSPFTIVRRSVS